MNMPSNFKNNGLFQIFLLALTCLCVLFFVKFAWVGFSESDDAFYAAAAQQWVGHWYLATTHWGLRHAIVLPMALAFRVFGRSELTLVFPTLLYLVLLLGLTFFAVRRIAGYYGGLIAVILVASIPVVATGASWVTTDLAETFFLLASVWVFYYALKRSKPAYFVLSGVAAGLGMITRETSIVLVVFYGVLMLFNYGNRRSNYLWIGVGAALVLGLDTLYLGASSGDLLYRLHVSQAGVKGDNPSMAAQFATQQGLDRFGTLAAPRWLQAWIVLFFNQNFGILPWLGLPAGMYLALKGSPQSRPVSRLFLLLALVWFVMLSYFFTFLWLVPRYQILTAFALVVPLAIWLAETVRAERYLLAGGALAAVVAAGVVAIGVSDRNPLFGEKTLAELALKSPSAIVTDPSTIRGAAWLLDANGTKDRVIARAPQQGDLYFYYDRPRRGLPQDWPVQQPGAGWIQVSRFDEPPRPLAQLILAIGADRVLPEPIIRKLTPMARRVTVYQVSSATTVAPPIPANPLQN